MLVGMEVGEEEGKGNGSGCSPEGDHALDPVSPGFYLCLAGGNLRGGLRGEV